jgi:hypothetical protein
MPTQSANSEKITGRAVNRNYSIYFGPRLFNQKLTIHIFGGYPGTLGRSLAKVL